MYSLVLAICIASIASLQARVLLHGAPARALLQVDCGANGPILPWNSPPDDKVCFNGVELLACDFHEIPAMLSQVAMLTFDDGPNAASGATTRVLDVLKDAGVKATFFVNIRNTVAVADSLPDQELIKRMGAEGHVVGSHGAGHLHMAAPDTDVEKELSDVESLVSSLIPGQKLTVRAQLHAPDSTCVPCNFVTVHSCRSPSS
jgi:Polysaccharide deacetylase